MKKGRRKDQTWKKLGNEGNRQYILVFVKKTEREDDDRMEEKERYKRNI